MTVPSLSVMKNVLYEQKIKLNKIENHSIITCLTIVQINL